VGGCVWERGEEGGGGEEGSVGFVKDIVVGELEKVLHDLGEEARAL
jgi:hypothetical protein